MSYASWIGITWESTSKPKIEWGTESWRVTRPSAWGIQMGIVFGPMRRHISLINQNPWSYSHPEGKLVVKRWKFVTLPWISIWWWRKTSGKDPHPARFYVGGKLFEAHDPPRERDVWRDPKLDPPGFYIAPSISFRDG